MPDDMKGINVKKTLILSLFGVDIYRRGIFKNSNIFFDQKGHSEKVGHKSNISVDRGHNLHVLKSRITKKMLKSKAGCEFCEGNNKKSKESLILDNTVNVKNFNV